MKIKENYEHHDNSHILHSNINNNRYYSSDWILISPVSSLSEYFGTPIRNGKIDPSKTMFSFYAMQDMRNFILNLIERNLCIGAYYTGTYENDYKNDLVCVCSSFEEKSFLEKYFKNHHLNCGVNLNVFCINEFENNYDLLQHLVSGEIIYDETNMLSTIQNDYSNSIRKYDDTIKVVNIHLLKYALEEETKYHLKYKRHK